MDISSAVLFLTSSIIIFLIIAVLFIIITVFVGQSVNDPEYTPVNGTVFGQLFYFGKLYDHLTEIAKKQPTFRLLAPLRSEIYTVDPRNVEHVLKARFEVYSKVGIFHEVLTDLLGDGIFAAGGSKWRQQRKLASVEFSTRILRDFSCSVFRRNAVKLVGYVREFAVSGRVFDVQDLLMRGALDSIFEVAFGVHLNSLDGTSRDGCEFMRALDESNFLVYWRFIDPTWRLKRLLNISCEAKLKMNIKIIDDFVYNLISTKRKLLASRPDQSAKQDLLSRFMMESKKNPDTMDDKYLRDIILSFIIAGKDTTGNTLSWFLYMLCKNPIVQEKIAQEVRDILGSQGNKTDTEDLIACINDEALRTMHYLHAALTETLRLYPAVPVNGRYAETDDVLPDGYKVNKGDAVFFVPYSMGRMQYVWGEDAEEFRPERWLENGFFEPESPYKFIAFNAGPRTCLGKDFAYLQMKIISMALLRFYRFRLADEGSEVKYKTMFTLHVDGGLNLCAVPRPIT